MRNLISLFLIGFLGICPILCEAAEIAQDLHRCEADATCPHPGEAPLALSRRRWELHL